MDQLEYNREYRILICKLCQYAVQPKHIVAHFRSAQHSLLQSDAKALALKYKDYDCIDPIRENTVPPRHIQPISPIVYLTIYRDGLACSACGYVCRVKRVMTDHQRKIHNVKVGHGRRHSPGELWTATWCQCFYTGTGQRYFRVQQPEQQQSTVANPVESESLTARVQQQIFQQLQCIETDLTQQRQILVDSQATTEVSSWLDRTQWLRHLDGQNRHAMAELLKEPQEREEDWLQEVAKSLQRLVTEAQATVQEKKVSSFCLHRLESFEGGKDAAKPFQVNLMPATIKRYQQVWLKLLYYVLRTANQQTRPTFSSSATEPTQAQIPGLAPVFRLYQLTAKQQSCIKNLEYAAIQIQQQQQESGSAQKLERLEEDIDTACLEFCIALLDHKLDHNEYESAVLSYLAVAALQYIPNQQSSSGLPEYKFSDAATYVATLSGLIKIGQLLTVEYCLQQQRQEQTTSCYGLLEQLHAKFLVTSTATPMDWILRLRLYCRGISRQTMVEGRISWIGETVTYRELELSMTDLRKLVHKLCDEAHNILLQDLLLVNGEAGQLPKIKWAELRDNAAKNEPYWYFVLDGRNCMTQGHKWMLQRVLAKEELTKLFLHMQIDQQVWQLGYVKEYLDKVEIFLEKLLVLIHITGGQPARASELLSYRYCNTDKGGLRCIFIENGMVSLVSYYHKSYNISRREKIVHRFLPRDVGELVVWYIWLVLPFKQQLQQLVLDKKDIPSAFLWAGDEYCKWTSERVRQILQRESKRLIGISLNISSYRHIAIAIANRYIKKNIFKEQSKEVESSSSSESDRQDTAVDQQAGHATVTAGNIYARQLEEAIGDTPDIRYRFWQVSIQWHKILQLDLEPTQTSRISKRPSSAREHEASPGPRFRRWQQLRQTDIHTALQRLMGERAQFYGRQAEALQIIMTGKSPIIVIMPTSGGKSLLFMLPASVPGAGVTVVVSPLLALKQDMQQRCQRLGLNCISWTSAVSANIRKRAYGNTILLITPESAVTKEFIDYVRNLQKTDQLDRVVIDECHILLNIQPDFRRQVAKLRQLLEFRTQLVLLTATLPPSKESEMLSAMSIEAPYIIRESTSRHNIKYSVLVRTGGIEQQIVRQVLADNAEDSRVIVYGGSIENCNRLARALDCKAYYANCTNKEGIMQDWLCGKQRIIVATNALGMGIDVGNVRLVLHATEGFSLLDYSQESGRAGRDGKPAQAVLLVSSNNQQQRRHSNIERHLIQQYTQTTKCRRILLDQYLDGSVAAEPCTERQEHCDNCILARQQEHGELQQKRQERAQQEEYAQQQVALVQQQTVYRTQVMVETETEARFREKLQRISHYCVYCYYHGLDGSQDHRFDSCKVAGDILQVYSEIKSEIRYTRYSACFRCGCPQWICKEWLPGGSRQCRYNTDVILGSVLVGLLDKSREEIQQIVGAETLDSREKIVEWLGKMASIVKQQASNAARVFMVLEFEGDRKNRGH